MKKLIFTVLLLASAVTWAQSGYVTDQFKITLRSGESSGHRIVRMIPTGMQLDILGQNRENGYSKVRTPDGVEGYVLTHQILDEPVARDRLGAAEAELTAMKTAPNELRRQFNELSTQYQSLQTAHKELQEIKQDIELELTSLQRTAANALRIANERNELRKQVADLVREAEEVKQQNQELENNSAQTWFLIGAGVIVGGILLGLILPHLRLRRRKDSWGSL